MNHVGWNLFSAKIQNHNIRQKILFGVRFEIYKILIYKRRNLPLISNVLVIIIQQWWYINIAQVLQSAFNQSAFYIQIHTFCTKNVLGLSNCFHPVTTQDMIILAVLSSQASFYIKWEWKWKHISVDIDIHHNVRGKVCKLHKFRRRNV